MEYTKTQKLQKIQAWQPVNIVSHMLNLDKTSLDGQPLQVSLLKDLPEKKETDAHSQPF